MSSARLIQEQRHELEYLADLIRWRLELCQQQEDEWNGDNRFSWRFALQGRRVPPDTEEQAAGFYESGEYEKAGAIFRLLIDCFPHYAEGHNYLGLIAYEQRHLEQAVGHFEKTIELGRKLFPGRIGKKRFWSDHSTRPYMRGLRNLTMTLNGAARFDEALALCDRLETECGDEFSAGHFRAAIYLNTGMWEQAVEYSKLSGGDLDPSSGFVEAFALFELGRPEEALPAFLHAALNFPRAAHTVCGRRMAAAKSNDEAEDHNMGLTLQWNLHAYLKNQRRAAKAFFQRLVLDHRVAELLDEITAVVRRRRDEHRTGVRSAFDRMQLMRSRPSAVAEAGRLTDLLAAYAG